MAFIGLDIGTSGCKCTIFSGEGNLCTYSYKEYQTLTPGPGLFELNPHTVWNSVKFVIGNCAKAYSGEKISSLCISSFGEAGIPVSKKGEILYNSLLYTDLRGIVQNQRLQETVGLENIMKLTGLHAHSMFTINKLTWIKENMPDVYKNTWKFMLFEDFILYKLCGTPAIDYSLASRTMAFNVTSMTWEQSILNAAGIEKDIFSPAVASGTVIGTIKNAIAEELGLPKNLRLVTGGHDQACAAIGGGIIEEGKAIDGIGTVECITPAFNQPLLNTKMLDNNYACVPHAKKGMYITYAFNFTGGSLLKWYRDNFAAGEQYQAEASGSNVYALLDSKAAAAKSSSILVLPHFAGAGTPYMDTCAKGAIIGLSFDTTSSQIYRALLEGVTFEMLYNLECLSEAGVTINELRAVGGGAKSELWLQIKSDILNKKIETLDVDEAGTLGTAILAGTATGVYDSLDEAAKKLVKVKRVYYPDAKEHERYMEKYRKYKKMYQAMKEITNG